MHKKILIATGGTGGHVFPSIALMEFLEKESYEVIFSDGLVCVTACSFYIHGMYVGYCGA